MNIVPFQFETKNIRVILVNEEPWFVGKDVAEALEYENPSKAISDHCEDSKYLSELYIPGAVINNQINDLHHKVKFISESDVYNLALASRAKGAKRFKSWLTKEVLPSIRKTGGYMMKPVSTLDMFELAGKAMRELEAKQIEIERKQQETDIKVSVLEDGLKSVRDILKVIDGKSYCRVSGYISKELKINLNLEDAKREGKAVKKLAVNRGIEIKKVNDTNHGSVNVYPIEFLKDIYKSGKTLTIGPDSVAQKVRSLRVVS